MSDLNDMASDLEEFHRELALKQRKYSNVKPKGTCHNCHEPVKPNQLFCDSECGTDYDKRQRNANNAN